MKEPGYIIIKRNCPKCGQQMVAYQERSLDEPGKVFWIVTCDACEYSYGEQFATLQELAKKFEAED